MSASYRTWYSYDTPSAEQHVRGGNHLTVDTLFGDDGVAAADDKRARVVYVFGAL